MGCGCGGRKTAARQKSAVAVQRAPAGAGKAAVAKTYQSATMKKAPTGPVNRKTV